MRAERDLEVLGLSEAEERTYRAVLRAPGSSATELKTAASIGDRLFRSTIAGLEEKGLVTRSPTSSRAYVPAPPDVAIEALVHNRQEALDRVRRLGREFLSEFHARARRGESAEVVDVVRGREAVLQRWRFLQRIARSEVLAFDTPPYVSDLSAPIDLELGRLKQGVRFRVVYSQAALEMQSIEEIMEATTAGEEARVLPSVPLKLDIADHTLALVPLELDEPGVESALVVRASPLLEALRELFEVLWERAVPLDAERPEDAPGAEVDHKLLTLLAAGMQDQAMARQLGCSLSTVRRRIAGLMRQVGARTRFQVGLQAAKRGWL